MPTAKPSIDWDAITDDAHDRVVAILKENDNTLSVEHKAALRDILESFSRIASGRLSGRVAWGLGTGLGKTSCIRAWLVAAASRPGVLETTGVAVACSKVEALCDLSRKLIEDGVDPDLIGLVHSYRYDAKYVNKEADGEVVVLKSGYASEPATDDPEQCPIALVTHNRVALGQEGLSSFQTYRGQERAAMFYDESLLISEAKSLDISSLREAVGGLNPPGPPIEGREDVNRWLGRSLSIVLDELARLESPNAHPKAIRLPALSEEAVERFKTTILDCGNDSFTPALILLDFAAEPLRVARLGAGQGLLSYTLRVPEELRNVVVLDASYPIRELERMDKTITDGEKLDFCTCPKDFASIKDHSEVTVKGWARAGGRSSMWEAFGGPKRWGRKGRRRSTGKKRVRDVSRAIVEGVKTIPPNERVLFFTYPPKEAGEPDYEDILQSDLEAAGIDVDATVDVGGKKLPRFCWSTWGKETSVNRYASVQNVFLVGIYRRSTRDIAGLLLGQSQDLLAPVTHPSIHQAQIGEVANAAYQAISRCAVRRVRNGRALKTTAWFLDYESDSVAEELAKVFPGAKFEAWSPDSDHSRKTHATSQRIKQHLTNPQLPEVVSVTALKRAILTTNDNEVSDDTFTRALKITLRSLPQWVKDGRSVRRLAGGL